MMLEKEWLCNMFEMLSRNRFIPLSTNYTKRGTQATTNKRKNSHANFKWASKGSGPKLLAPIASNKNG
jgi:hypothetical protein